MITGDTHGDYGQFAYNLQKLAKIEEGSRMFHCGDFGFIWRGKDEASYEDNLLDKLNDIGVHILFVDGNHENFDRLLHYPEMDLFGGKVGVIRENISHLKRGYVYNIDGKKIFTMGGGVSIDKYRRVEGISWWPQELHSKEEQDRAIDNLEANNWEVDFVITHSAPKQAEKMIQESMQWSGEYGEWKMNVFDAEGKFHTHVCDRLKFSEWHFGHYHQQSVSTDDRFHLHYDKAVKFF